MWYLLALPPPHELLCENTSPTWYIKIMTIDKEEYNYKPKLST